MESMSLIPLKIALFLVNQNHLFIYFVCRCGRFMETKLIPKTEPR